MEEKRKFMKNGYHQLEDELKNIGSIDLTCKATNVLEKILWISFGLVGIGWFAFFMIGVIEDINPLTSIREDIKLKDVNYPAITICSDSTAKYALAERLGNYIDPNIVLPDKLKLWMTNFINDTINIYIDKSTKNYFMDCKGHPSKHPRKYCSSACEVNYVVIFSSKVKSGSAYYYTSSMYVVCCNLYRMLKI